MTKDEALDLALEALEELQPDDAYPYSLQSKAITAIKQARSAPYVASPRVQSAERGEPVAVIGSGFQLLYCREDWAKGLKIGDKLYTTPPGGRQSEDCLTAAQEDIQRLSALVRAQQITIDKLEAQRPVAEPHKWVGLTDEELDGIYAANGGTRTRKQIAAAIEAKLKEKNGLHRQHVIDGSPCWCEPETSYTDPETGASVIVHKEPQ